MTFKLPACCVFSAFGLLACTAAPGGGADGSVSPCKDVPAATADEVFNASFSATTPAGCALSGCHAGSTSGFTFRSAHELWLNTVNKPATSKPGSSLVVPGDPTASVLYQRVALASPTQMPPAGPYLEQAQVDQLAGWICAGAPEPDFDGGIGEDAGVDGGNANDAGFALLSVSPASVLVGSGPITLSLGGSGFLTTDSVTFDGVAIARSFVSPSLLTAPLAGAITSTASSHLVKVQRGSMTSAGVPFDVSNPVPTLNSLSVTQVPIGAPASAVSALGSGFAPKAVVDVDGVKQTTTFKSATQLVFNFPTPSAARSYSVTVTNPGPGGGASASLSISGVNQTAPFIAAIDPESAESQKAVTVTVTGLNYVCTGAVGSRAVLQLDAGSFNPFPCTATSLQVALPPLPAGTQLLTVKNQGTGEVSNVVPLTVVDPNPAPTITSISPTSVGAGTAAFTLTVNGTGFNQSTVVLAGSTALLTTFASTTRVTAVVPALAVASGSMVAITAVNPAPGGGTSNAVALNLTASNPTPSVTSLTPCGKVAGAGAFTLTVAGTGFVAGSTATFNGVAVPVSGVTSTSLSLAVPATLIATAPASNAVPVIIANPLPGGGSSAAVMFGLATATSTLAGTVQPIFNASCTNGMCHSSGAANVPVSLTAGSSLAQLVGVTCSECPPRLCVKACSPLPADSYLVAKITNTDICSGTRMPKAAPLSASDIQKIKDWVAQGAPP